MSIMGQILKGKHIFVFIGLVAMQCEYLSDPNLLRKSAEDTKDFKCSINSNVSDGIIKNKSYGYKVHCIAKKGKVRFINFKVSLITKSGSRARALAEQRLNNDPVVVTPEHPFEYTGQIGVNTTGLTSGRRTLHLSSNVDYPDEAGFDGINVEQDKINNPWRYQLLTTFDL